MQKVELLAPAGSMECLDEALHFGADAVYLAGKKFGLRAFADNFTEEELKIAVEKVHALNKKIYITVNSLFHNGSLDELPAYLKYLKEINVDAVIVSDPGVFELCKEAGLTIHISTQMSTMNYRSVLFWYNQGAERVILAREVSLAEIAEMREKFPEELEIEAFVHGAMCVAYSGRCLLSAVLTGRSGNSGACAQTCRWKFAISEERERSGQYFPIAEDNHETFILNSKDMMMIEHVPEMIEAGITSFKVEGRMKSRYYVASVINAYRRAIDKYYQDKENYSLDNRLVTDLKDCATRGFTTGFYFDNGDNANDHMRDKITRDYVFCGVVLEENDENGYLTVEQRNKFEIGDVINVLSPGKNYGLEFSVSSILDGEGLERESAPHPQEIIKVKCPYKLNKGDLLRVYKAEKGDE